MKINVNGEEKKIELDQENALLSAALKSMGYKPNTIVVELNNLIINSIKWEKVKLKDGDNLEIVSIVGGG
jgi:sulfur carrier protein|tara:strand:+ start:319 stop:528 length:210 start_codon:yes stop_codon:yes gene_type:complete